ncbi:hypothetical protein [Amaricoccus sp.]|uniref:hypothetical protein n=1 Tax=Amaricoccus sp. TaxID=1872485 RepID=UPI001B6437ED|nr:hypothetical protein [Amaricoccus sp.]MBP7001166.1 hypothetical protein [Amaricoccus sp.]
MKTDLEASLAADTPPAGMTPALEALWWLRKGGFRTGPEWEKAHEICQSREGDHAHDLVHALAHWIEGDRGNSDYWYRRAGERRFSDDAAQEWTRLVEKIGPA